VKVLMQNCVTGRFLGKDDEWHESAGRAQDFGTGASAIAYYVAHRVPDAQIVLYFGADPHLNIRLPMSRSCQQTRT